jgi:hypothetical protein
LRTPASHNVGLHTVNIVLPSGIAANSRNYPAFPASMPLIYLSAITSSRRQLYLGPLEHSAAVSMPQRTQQETRAYIYVGHAINPSRRPKRSIRMSPRKGTLTANLQTVFRQPRCSRSAQTTITSTRAQDHTDTSSPSCRSYSRGYPYQGGQDAHRNAVHGSGRSYHPPRQCLHRTLRDRDENSPSCSPHALPHVAAAPVGELHHRD